jgi:hypothetical protein
MPARNPAAVRQRAIAAVRQRSGQSATQALDPVFVALNPSALPGRARPEAELFQWVRREEQDAILGANVVVELYSESHARQPTTGPGRSSDGPTAATGWPANAPAAPTEPTAPAAPTTPGAGDGGRYPLSPPAPTSEQRAVPHSLSTLMSLAHDPRRRQVMSRLSTIPKGAQPTRNQPIYWSRGNPQGRSRTGGTKWHTIW